MNNLSNFSFPYFSVSAYPFSYNSSKLNCCIKLKYIYDDDLDLIVDLSDDGISHDVHYIKVCPECKQDGYLMDINIEDPAEN